jgi:hypothetical protein
MMARRAAILADRSASASASRSRSVSLRAGPEEEDEDEDAPEADAPPPDDTAPAPPATADFVDGEMSGSFAPLAAVTTQQQAIRVRRVRMGVQK